MLALQLVVDFRVSAVAALAKLRRVPNLEVKVIIELAGLANGGPCGVLGRLEVRVSARERVSTVFLAQDVVVARLAVLFAAREELGSESVLLI